MVPVSQDDPGESDPAVIGAETGEMFLLSAGRIIQIQDIPIGSIMVFQFFRESVRSLGGTQAGADRDRSIYIKTVKTVAFKLHLIDRDILFVCLLFQFLSCSHQHQLLFLISSVSHKFRISTDVFQFILGILVPVEVGGDGGG